MPLCPHLSLRYIFNTSGRRNMADGKKKDKKRPSWDEYFLGMTEHVASRTTCLNRGVGAIIVKDKRILSTGYNGSPRGTHHCLNGTCHRKDLGIPTGERYDICRAVHAEPNAIIQAAVHGVSVRFTTMYCNLLPCIGCAKVIVNSMIRRVVYSEHYNNLEVIKLFKEAEVELTHMKGVKK